MCYVIILGDFESVGGGLPWVNLMIAVGIGSALAGAVIMICLLKCIR